MDFWLKPFSRWTQWAMSPLCDYIWSAECPTRIDICSNLQNAHMYSLICEEKYDGRAQQNFLTTGILKENRCHINEGLQGLVPSLKR